MMEWERIRMEIESMGIGNVKGGTERERGNGKGMGKGNGMGSERVRVRGKRRDG
jgi:hypothetical protein